jgi:hypothetical protein
MNRITGWYNTMNIQEPYMYLIALIYRLYGEKDCSKFSEACIPLTHTMAILGSSFSWGAIISKKLNINLSQAQTSKEGEVLVFYMASYLLDVICARFFFAGMNLSWHVFELSVHVYFMILWENIYKRSYSLICDEFLARVYFLIFRKEFPRISMVAKKMITNIGQCTSNKPTLTLGCSELPMHPTFSLFMSQITSFWGRSTTRPS